MQRISCTHCGKYYGVHMMFNDINCRICIDCRGILLSGLNYFGVEMTEENPYIAELCQDSHVLESSHWQYYDHFYTGLGNPVSMKVTRKKEVNLHLTSPSNRVTRFGTNRN